MPYVDNAWAWIIIGAVLAGLEVVAPGVYLLWIGLGAFAVGIVMALAPGLGGGWQALIFAIAMLGSLTLGFWVQRRGPRSADAELLNRETQAMIGKRYVALTDFELGRGRIKVGDSSYAAVSDDAIRVGETVEVVSIVDDRPKVTRAPRADGAV